MIVFAPQHQTFCHNIKFKFRSHAYIMEFTLDTSINLLMMLISAHTLLIGHHRFGIPICITSVIAFRSSWALSPKNVSFSFALLSLIMPTVSDAMYSCFIKYMQITLTRQLSIVRGYLSSIHEFLCWADCSELNLIVCAVKIAWKLYLLIRCCRATDEMSKKPVICTTFASNLMRIKFEWKLSSKAAKIDQLK